MAGESGVLGTSGGGSGGPGSYTLNTVSHAVASQTSTNTQKQGGMIIGQKTSPITIGLLVFGVVAGLYFITGGHK